MDKKFFNKVRILDGGMGQEILNRGVKPHGTIWGATALLHKKYHKIVVNNGRRPDQSLVMGSLEVSIKDEAIRILDGMVEIAKFMDEVVTFEDENIWMNSLEKQKNTINDYGLSLSESILNEISNEEMSFQEYGMNISKQHHEYVASL